MLMLTMTSLECALLNQWDPHPVILGRYRGSQKRKSVHEAPNNPQIAVGVDERIRAPIRLEETRIEAANSLKDFVQKSRMHSAPDNATKSSSLSFRIVLGHSTARTAAKFVRPRRRAGRARNRCRLFEGRPDEYPARQRAVARCRAPNGAERPPSGEPMPRSQ
jgi:hypothetical protein